MACAQWGWGWSGSGCAQGVLPTTMVVDTISGKDSVNINTTPFNSDVTEFKITYRRGFHPTRTSGTLLGTYTVADTAAFNAGKNVYLDRDGGLYYFNLVTKDCKYSLDSKQDTVGMVPDTAAIITAQGAGDQGSLFALLEILDFPAYVDSIEIYWSKDQDTVTTRGEGLKKDSVNSDGFLSLNSGQITNPNDYGNRYTISVVGSPTYYFYVWYRGESGLWSEVAQEVQIPITTSVIDTTAPDTPGFSATLIPDYDINISNYVPPDSTDVQSISVSLRSSDQDSWMAMSENWNPADTILYLGNLGLIYHGEDTLFVAMAALDEVGNSSDSAVVTILPTSALYLLKGIEGDTDFVHLDTMKVGIGSSNSAAALNYEYKFPFDSATFVPNGAGGKDSFYVYIPAVLLQQYDPCYVAVITWDTSNVISYQVVSQGGADTGDSLVFYWDCEESGDITTETPAGSVNPAHWPDSTVTLVNASNSSTWKTQGTNSLRWPSAPAYATFNIANSALSDSGTILADVRFDTLVAYQSFFQINYGPDDKIYVIFNDPTDELIVGWMATGQSEIQLITSGLNIAKNTTYSGANQFILKWRIGASDTTLYVGIGGNENWDNVTLTAWADSARNAFFGPTGSNSYFSGYMDNIRAFNQWLSGSADVTPPDSAAVFLVKGHELGIRDSAIAYANTWNPNDLPDQMSGRYAFDAYPASRTAGISWLAEQAFDSTICDTVGFGYDTNKDTVVYARLFVRDAFGNWQTTTANKDTVLIDSTGGASETAEFVMYCENIIDLNSGAPTGINNFGSPGTAWTTNGTIAANNNATMIVSGDSCIKRDGANAYMQIGDIGATPGLKDQATVTFEYSYEASGYQDWTTLVLLSLDADDYFIIQTTATNEIYAKYSGQGVTVDAVTPAANLVAGTKYTIAAKFRHGATDPSVSVTANASTGTDNTDLNTAPAGEMDLIRIGDSAGTTTVFYIEDLRVWNTHE
jgi:hypothetical protein